MQFSSSPQAGCDTDTSEKRDAFLRLLEQTLELPSRTLTSNEPLAAVKEWDSMAVVQFLALADERFGMILDYEQVAGCRTFADLFALTIQ